MLIFDASTFLNNKLGLECWTIKGLRPKIFGNPKPSGLHLLLLLASEGIESVQILKEGVREATTRDFLMWSIGKIVASRGSRPPIEYLFLDNASTNSIAIAEEVKSRFGISIVFSYPSSPRNNAVESVFGMLNKKYRSFAASERAVRPDDIFKVISESLKMSVRRTIDLTIRQIIRSARDHI